MTIENTTLEHQLMVERRELANLRLKERILDQQITKVSRILDRHMVRIQDAIGNGDRELALDSARHANDLHIELKGLQKVRMMMDNPEHFPTMVKRATQS